MKKVICFLLCAFFFFGTFEIFAESENGVSVTYILSESFDSLSDGESPDGISLIAKNNKFTYVNAGRGTNGAIRFDALGESDMHMDSAVSTNEDNVFLEFEIMLEDKGYGNGEFLVCFKDTAGKEVEIFRITASRDIVLSNGRALATLVPNKFYAICIELDFLTNKADIYINHKKKANAVSLSTDDFDSISVLRTHLLSLSQDEKPVIYIDNLAAYESELPVFRYEERGINLMITSTAPGIPSIADEETVVDYMQGTIALYVGQNKIALDGEVGFLDPTDKSVIAFVKDGRTYVPVRFISEALGYDVKWSEINHSVTVSDGENTVVFTVGDNTLNINGTYIQIDVAPFIDNDRIFIPVRAVCEAFGKKLTYDKSGLIVIADCENFFDMRNDLGVFRTLAGNLVFDVPSGEDLIQRLKTNYPSNSHPRIHFNQARLNKIKDSIQTEPLMMQWKQDVVETADNYMNQALLRYEIPDEIRLLQVSREAWARIETLSFTYLITEDARYADRAIAEMLNVCSFKDWNPYHFLDTAEMMRAVATGYDWLYNYMSVSDRTKVREALVDMGLKQIIEDYNNVPGRRRTWLWAQSAEPDNWNLVCNGGALIAALAIADEEEEICSQVLDSGLKLIQKAVLLYGPDGAWYEGPGYWEYATSYYVGLMSAMNSVFGDTFGYMNVPGVAETGYYINALSGHTGVFNFHDAVSDKISSPTLFFLSDVLDDASLAQLRLDFMVDNDVKATSKDMMWYNTSMTGASVTMPKDYYYRDTEVVTMRSNWNGASAIMTGLHSGKINVYHGHMDAGQFIIDAFGTRYAIDMPPENYNIKDNIWNLYRNRAEGHNTLVINPSKDGGQDLAAEPKIDRYDSCESSAYAITDITGAYEAQAKSVKRGLKLTNNRTVIILQDEFELKVPSEVKWFMHTECDVEIADDGKSARVKGNYRDMIVYLLEDVDGTFSYTSASPMPTSPVNDEQDKNFGFGKLVFTMQNVTEGRIPLGFSFVLPGGDASVVYTPDVKPLDEWDLDYSEIKELPKLKNLTVNGEPVKMFSPDKLMYNYRLSDGETIPTVVAESNDDVEIKYPKRMPGYIEITVISKANKSVRETYMISISQEILSKAPMGYTSLNIDNVDATSTPQPENSASNVLDGSLDTRWSALGVESLIFDLGEIKKVGAIALAVYQENDDRRLQFFKIYISKDGQEYTQVFEGRSSGTTLEKELFPFDVSEAKYIKVECHGTSVGSWNSITEFCAFAPEE